MGVLEISDFCRRRLLFFSDFCRPKYFVACCTDVVYVLRCYFFAVYGTKFTLSDICTPKLG